MPTLLPARAPAPGVFDPAVQVWLAMGRVLGAIGHLARGIWREEMQGPTRGWRDYVGFRELRAESGGRLRASDVEARSWDL